MALLAGAAVFLLVWLTGGVAPRRRQTVSVRYRANSLRKEQDTLLRLARAKGTDALESRAYARQMARDIQRFQWDAAFHRIADPVRADRLAAAIPQREGLIVTYSRRASEAEATAAAALQRARKVQADLAKATPKARQEADLVVLARVCVQGWLARRRKP